MIYYLMAVLLLIYLYETNCKIVLISLISEYIFLAVLFVHQNFMMIRYPIKAKLIIMITI